MSLFRRLAAAFAAAALLMVFAASCHEKDEIALKIGDIEIKGAMYQAYLIQADSEARNKLSSDSSSSSSTSSKITNYSKETVEGKSFNTWVKDRAMELCKNHAIVETLFKKYDLKLTDDEIDYINYYIQQYYAYGYLSIFTDNGVSLATYAEMMKISYKSAAIFKYYYDKDGTKAVSEKDKKEALEKLYVLANTIEVSLTKTDSSGSSTTMTTEEQDKTKTLLEGYAQRIKKGTAFSVIKEEYDKKVAEENKTSSGATSSQATSSQASSQAASGSSATSATSSEAEKAPEPLDKNATAYGSSEASSPSDYFEKLKEMKVGDVSVIKFDDAFVLAVRKDILADPYYLTTYNDEVLSFLKGDEYEKELKDEANKLPVEEHSFVTNYYTPKKIKYPEGA